MSLLKLFSGPSPEKLEKKGDTLFDAERWGQAKVEYERALHKLEKQIGPADNRTQRVAAKILKAREALAREHRQTACDLIDGGYFNDAKEMLTLAMEVAADDGFRQEIAQDLKALTDEQNLISDVASPNPSYSLARDDEAEPFPVSTEDENFYALLSTLPEEIQEDYLSYGEAFKNGYVALHDGDFLTADSCFVRAMEENPGPETYIPLELAVAYVNLNRSDEAQILLGNFLEHHPDTLPAYQLLCEIYWEQRNYHKADRLLDSVPIEFAESLAIFLLRGETRFQSGNFKAAEDFYQDILDTYGWDETVARELAKACEAGGNPDHARNIYKEIMDRCNSCHSRIDPLIKHKYVELRFEARTTDTDVLEIYLSLAQEIPENAAYYFDKISRIYTNQGNFSEAERFRIFSQRAKAEQEE